MNEKKINLIFILRIVLLCIFTSFLIMRFLSALEITIISDQYFGDFILFFSLGSIFVLISVIFLVTAGDDDVKSLLIAILLIAILVSIYSLTFVPKAFEFKIPNMVPYLIYFCILILYFFHIMISNKKKFILLEIEKHISSFENENQFSQFIKTYNIINKKSRKIKILFPIFNDRKKYKFIKNQLKNNEQIYIKNILLKNYNLIISDLKIKELGLCRKINICSLDLKNALRDCKLQFDESNKSFSKTIDNNLTLIINFTNRYKNSNDIDGDRDIDSMKGHVFEKFCANLLMLYGFSDVVVTKGSGDQGVDIVGRFSGIKYAIQCKRYAKKVGNTPIQEVVGGKKWYGCYKTMVITNNYFTDDAIKLAEVNDVILWDRQKLNEVIFETDSYWQDLLDVVELDIEMDKM